MHSHQPALSSSYPLAIRQPSSSYRLAIRQPSSSYPLAIRQPSSSYRLAIRQPSINTMKWPTTKDPSLKQIHSAESVENDRLSTVQIEDGSHVLSGSTRSDPLHYLYMQPCHKTSNSDCAKCTHGTLLECVRNGASFEGKPSLIRRHIQLPAPPLSI